jgi:protein-tyrosine phosphatase
MQAQVLIVCRANICRSPMAEVLMRQGAAARQRRLTVASAGIEAAPGLLADPLCHQLLQERGLSLAAHRSSRFSRTEAQRYDLILVMEARQRDHLRHVAPWLAGRIHCLGRWTQGDIADPHGGPRPLYEACLHAIDDALSAWLQRL